MVYFETETGKLQKMKEKLASPVFNSPWGKSKEVVSISLQEEIQPGYVVSLVSALNPMTGEVMTNLSISGIFADYFQYDEITGGSCEEYTA